VFSLRRLSLPHLGFGLFSLHSLLTTLALVHRECTAFLAFLGFALKEKNTPSRRWASGAGLKTKAHPAPRLKLISPTSCQWFRFALACASARIMQNKKNKKTKTT
jgi:hypothetical protein